MKRKHKTIPLYMSEAACGQESPIPVSGMDCTIPKKDVMRSSEAQDATVSHNHGGGSNSVVAQDTATETASLPNPKEEGRRLPKLIYECYKPETLAETKEYTEFVLNSRYIVANEVEEQHPDSLDNDLSEEVDARVDAPYEALGPTQASRKVGARLTAYLEIWKNKMKGKDA